MIIADIGLITTVFVCIEIRVHVSTAAPVLIANAKEIQFPWFLMSVFLTEVSHRGNTFECNVLNPLRHFLYCSASQISVNVCFTSKLFAEFKEFMSTKAVIFYNTAPVCVDHFLTCFFRADTIFPVVFICETATRPAKYRNLDVLQCFYYICTHSVLVRDRGILSYIDSFIDTSSQML